MNKQRFLRLALILLPLIAVGVACMPTSVMIFSAETKETAYCSYLQLLPEGSFQIGGVLAVLLASVSGGLAITYSVGKKEKLLMPIRVLAVLSMLAAVTPILLQSEPKVVPNVAVPILMGIQWILAGRMKRPQEETKKIGRRL